MASKIESGRLIVKEKEITDPKEISNNIKVFYETLFKQNSSKTTVERQEFLSSLDTETFTNQQSDLSENEIRENDLFDSVKSKNNNKTPGNDGLTNEFYKTFWDELKSPLMEGINRFFFAKILSISQRQTVIKLIGRKHHDKQYIRNWRPIYLLNVDTKILSKAVSRKLKAVLPTLIFSQQTAYVENRFIGESGRLIFDVIEISDWLNIEGFLVNMDIDKCFDSLDHDFISSVLRKFRFGKKLYCMNKNLMKRSILMC